MIRRLPQSLRRYPLGLGALQRNGKTTTHPPPDSRVGRWDQLRGGELFLSCKILLPNVLRQKSSPPSPWRGTRLGGQLPSACHGNHQCVAKPTLYSLQRNSVAGPLRARSVSPLLRIACGHWPFPAGRFRCKDVTTGRRAAAQVVTRVADSSLEFPCQPMPAAAPSCTQRS